MSPAIELGVDRPGASPPASMRRDLALLLWQLLYEQRSFWRNRRRAIASLGFPLMFLVIFGALTHGQHLKSLHHLGYINFYVPGIISYAVMVIGFTSVAMSISLLRAEGILKRMRATPMPWALYLGGIVLSTVATVAVATVLLLVIGIAFYGAQLRSAGLPGLIVTVALATACFTSLGIAVSRLIPKPDTGMPMLMFIVLPIAFVSNVFFRLEHSKVLEAIGRFFPLWHVSEGVGPAFHPWAHGAGLLGGALLSLAIWTVVGCVLMVRTMTVLSAKD